MCKFRKMLLNNCWIKEKNYWWIKEILMDQKYLVGQRKWNVGNNEDKAEINEVENKVNKVLPCNIHITFIY